MIEKYYVPATRSTNNKTRSIKNLPNVITRLPIKKNNNRKLNYCENKTWNRKRSAEAWRKNKLRRKESASKKWLTPDIRFRMRIRSEKKNNLIPPPKKNWEKDRKKSPTNPAARVRWVRAVGLSDVIRHYCHVLAEDKWFFFSMAASILSMRRATCACGCAFVDPPADRLQQDFRENVLQREGVLIIVTIIIDGSEAIVSFSGNIYLSIPCLTFLWRVRASCLLNVFSSLQISHLTFCLFVLWIVSSWRVRS